MTSSAEPGAGPDAVPNTGPDAAPAHGFAALRGRFLAAARRAGADVTGYPHPLRGPDDEPLASDVARLGPADAANLLVIVSGTHGVEGPFGSACQSACLSRLDAGTVPADTAIVVLHLLNPWGAAWSRRVDE